MADSQDRRGLDFESWISLPPGVANLMKCKCRDKLLSLKSNLTPSSLLQRQVFFRFTEMPAKQKRNIRSNVIFNKLLRSFVPVSKTLQNFPTSCSHFGLPSHFSRAPYLYCLTTQSHKHNILCFIRH